MKKLLLSSIALLVFSISLVIFQMSCQKTVLAQTSTQSINKILLSQAVQVQIGSVADSLGHVTPIYRFSVDFYLVQYDGANLSKINITMPPGVYPSGYGLLTPDGEKLIFEANSDITNSIYSYSLDGSGLTKLLDGNYGIRGAY